MSRLLENTALAQKVYPFLPQLTWEEFLALGKNLREVESFQANLISPVIETLLKKTCQSFTTSGFESLSKHKKYLFISNHRDIICDPALLTNSLYLQGFTTPQICLGDNLLVNSCVTDLVKMNKGLIVKRNLSLRELIPWSLALSQHIRQQIIENKSSIWIAQREGRAKDGHDETQPSILKMLAMSQKGSWVESLKPLHILPVSISYEYDPCDFLKAKELWIKQQNQNYSKSKNEDLISMQTGILESKGHIHLALGEEITPFLDSLSSLSQKEQLQAITKKIDQSIYQNYHPWPSHYIAFDLLTLDPCLEGNYSTAQKEEFVERMEKQLDRISQSPDEKEYIKHYYLKSYAQSLINYMKHTTDWKNHLQIH